MVFFNVVNKLLMYVNVLLIQGWLCGGQGFDGLVVLDYIGVKELGLYGLGSFVLIVVCVLYVGVDMDMVGEDYLI